ncbi:hypothetical protein Taro_009536, partial [Colocasia esculenta]|nr:hypothetical protein [Colocasia esculenta]
MPGPKFHHGACVLIHRLSYPFGKMWIFIRAVIRTARETPIWNRHFDSAGIRTLVLLNFMPGPKFHRGAYVLIHRLSYPFGKMWIFVLTAIRTAYESPIWNRHFDPVGAGSDSEISDPVPKFLSGCVFVGCRCDRIRTPLRSNGNVSLDHVNPGRSNHMESACHGDRKLCSTRCENSCS